MALTHEQYLAEARRLTQEWSDRYADRIPVEPSLSAPHGADGVSDLPEHHHLVGAPDFLEDILDEKLVALTKRYHEGRD